MVIFEEAAKSRFGASERVRTVDLYLGKVPLYQLSYTRDVDSLGMFRNQSAYCGFLSAYCQVCGAYSVGLSVGRNAARM